MTDEAKPESQEQTPPVEQAEATPPAAAQQVAEKVSEAASSATQAASQTGEEGWKVVAEELRGLRTDVQALLKQGERAASTPAKEEKKAAAAASVQVTTPQKQVKKVFRNGRWVTREVK